MSAKSSTFAPEMNEQQVVVLLRCTGVEVASESPVGHSVKNRVCREQLH